MNPLLGIFYHAVGGFAAGSFYIPYNRVRHWAWEVYWLVGGFFAWVLMPWVITLITVPDILGLMGRLSMKMVLWPFLFGMIWGIGGTTFGLTMRYLGMSLGMSLALGLTATFGTLVPPLYYGQMMQLLATRSGMVTLGGVAICLFGIAVTGLAGIFKDKELSTAEKTAQIREFDLKKGLVVALIAGVMSAGFAFGIAAGKPIAELAVEFGAPKLYSNSPTYIFIMFGGFVSNFFYCIYLTLRNRTYKDYIKKSNTPLLKNYIFCALAGITWYCQFLFYGMGTTLMGRYDFASWSIHMAFIITFSNMWGLVLKEWKGSRRRTIRTILLGLAILVLSTCVIGLGNYIQQYE
ncbi:MAG: L-rhamnose/proton symporter RhaT [Calditrichaeota bacterium]|nr:MAG: L-rhamnose/proton symporter RhaT [Calditrichota bacterium]